jgi:hypothetical protein
MKVRNVVTVLGLAIAAAAVPAVAEARTSFDLTTPPPAPLFEPAPGYRPGYTWAPGYWNWEGQHHSWVAGSWMNDHPGYSWQPHSWVQNNNNHWQLQHGQWNADSHHANAGGNQNQGYAGAHHVR